MQSEGVDNKIKAGVQHLRIVVLTMVCFGVLPYLIPGLERFQPWVSGDPIPFSGLLDVQWTFKSGRSAGGIAAPDLGGGSTGQLTDDLGEDLAGSVGELKIGGGTPAPSLPEESAAAVAVQIPEEETNDDESPVPEKENKVQEVVRETPVNPIASTEWEGGTAWFEEPGPDALKGFYEKLHRLASGEDVQVRIAHYGDSTIAADDVTQTLRRNLQRRFGDAGHGYLVPARGKLPYGHRDVRRKEEGDWEVTTITSGGLRRGEYGYGGMVVRGYPGASFRVGTVKEAPVGTAVSKLKLFTEATKGRGRFKVRVDREKPLEFSTQGDPGIQVHEVPVSDGGHQFKVNVSRGKVSFYGVALERDVPGVIYDSLGLVGAIGKRLTKWGSEHIKQAFSLREPDLLILHFGGNESAYSNMTAKRYEKDLRAMLTHVRGATPQSSCMLFSPLDQGHKVRGRIKTVPILLDIVAIQRRVSAEFGCAFWSTFDAMGGENAIAKWRKSRLASGDLRHATRAGYELIGNLAYKAFLRGFSDYWKRENSEPN